MVNKLHLLLCLYINGASQVVLVVKNLPSNAGGSFPSSSGGKGSAHGAGDPGLIPGSRRSPEKGNGYLLQYSCLENSMEEEVYGAIKSQTRMSN